MKQSTRTRVVLAVSVVAMLMIHLLPAGGWIAYPLLLLSTLAHELGHGLAALVAGGRFHRLLLFADGSGIAELSLASRGGLRSAIVSAGGLVGPAVAAAACFIVGRTPRGARLALGVTAVVLLLTLLLFVRTLFGALFVGLVAFGLFAAHRWASDDVAQLVVVFLGVELSLSVFVRGDYLFTPVARTANGPMPSDVAQMAMALPGPYWFWGFVCALLSVVVLLVGLRSYLR